MKYAHYLFLGFALISGCTGLEDPEVKDPSEVPIDTETLFVDAFESNDDANSATPIEIGLQVKARIQTSQDVDFYSFAVPDSFAQGGFVIAHLAPFPGRPELSFYNEQKQSYGIRTYNTTEGADLSAWISAAPGKTYYAGVKDWYNGVGKNPYTLRLEFVPVSDPLEPNNKLNEAVAIALDSTYAAFMYHRGSRERDDVFDHYKVTLADSGRIQVALTRFPGEMMPEFSILDANGKSYARFYSTTAGSDLIKASDPLAPGGYIVQVIYWNGTPALGGEGSELPEAGTKPYNIKVSALPKSGI